MELRQHIEALTQHLTQLEISTHDDVDDRLEEEFGTPSMVVLFINTTMDVMI